MPAVKKRSIALLIILLAGLIFFITRLYDRAAPNIDFTTISGNQINLSDWLGKPVIVTFWASNCPACIREIPHLIDLYEQYHEKGLQILSIAMAYDRPDHVVATVNNWAIPYTVAYDLHGDLSKAFGNVILTPTTFLISPDGKITRHITGQFDPNELQLQIKKQLTIVNSIALE